MRSAGKGPESMIITFATKNYLHWLEYLLRTYSKTNPDKKAKVYLLMEYGEFDLFKRKYESKLFDFHWIPVRQSLNIEIDKRGRIRSVLRLKTSIILWELIINPGKRFIWADADCLILKDIQPILDELDNYDFLATERPWKKEDHHKLAAGVMGIISNPNTIKFMAMSAKDVWSHWEGWYSEQLHIYRNLRLNIPPILSRSLTEQEHSLNNDKDTIILSHHVNKFEDFARICQEMNIF